MMPLRNLQN